MKIITVYTVLFFSVLSSLYAQKYSFKEGELSFTVLAPAGNLLAIDSTISGAINIDDGTVFFDVAVKDFRFVSAFMPDYINTVTTKRFHQYYMESELYPLASFNGKISNARKINFSRNGTYKVDIAGVLTMHGISHKVTRSAQLIVKGQDITLQTKFSLIVTDYNIRVPQSIAGIFFNEVEIQANYRLVKQ